MTQGQSGNNGQVFVLQMIFREKWNFNETSQKMDQLNLESILNFFWLPDNFDLPLLKTKARLPKPSGKLNQFKQNRMQIRSSIIISFGELAAWSNSNPPKHAMRLPLHKSFHFHSLKFKVKITKSNDSFSSDLFTLLETSAYSTLRLTEQL